MIQAAVGLPFSLAEDAAETLHTTYGWGRVGGRPEVFTVSIRKAQQFHSRNNSKRAAGKKTGVNLRLPSETAI